MKNKQKKKRHSAIFLFVVVSLGGDTALKPHVCAGTSTPPSIAATPVPALPPPIAVNSYPSVPAPPSGQSATDALYTNGVHAYQGTYRITARMCVCCVWLMGVFTPPQPKVPSWTLCSRLTQACSITQVSLLGEKNS